MGKRKQNDAEWEPEGRRIEIRERERVKAERERERERGSREEKVAKRSNES